MQHSRREASCHALYSSPHLMEEPFLHIEELATGYGHGSRRHTVCRHLNGTLPRGTLTLLLGANGSGKSTLLRTLAGLQPPLAGRIGWGGQDTARLTPGELARTLSIVLTTRPEAPLLTAAEVAEMGRIPYSRALRRPTQADRVAVARAMALTGTESLARRTLGTLSDGERQRVFLSKALAQETPAILLDEPTAFLDHPGKRHILRLLHRIAHEEGKLIIVSTHDVELALHAADGVWLLRPDGIRTLTPEEAMSVGPEALFG